MPPCRHRASVPPPCRLVAAVSTDKTHWHTSVHSRTWHISPRTWHLSIIPLPRDTVCRNFTIWSVAKNSHDNFNKFTRRTIGFPLNMSQYCAIRKSTISHKEVNERKICLCWMSERIVHVFGGYVASNLWIACTHYIFLYIRTFKFSMNGLSYVDILEEFESTTINH